MHTSIELKEDMEERVKNLLSGNESISVFSYKAIEERVKRMEARSERARLQMLSKDKEALRPIIQQMIDDGELNIKRYSTISGICK